MRIKLINKETNEEKIIEEVISFDEHSVVQKAGLGKLYTNFDDNYILEEYNEQVD